MLRLSALIARLEEKAEKKLKQLNQKHKLRKRLPYICLGLFFYAMLVNSIGSAIDLVYGTGPPRPLIEWNPLVNLAALFSPAGLGVTFFVAVMYILYTKKGFQLLTGRKIIRDPRGFDILPEGTHGTSGWLPRGQMEEVFQLGAAKAVTGTLLGKYAKSPDDAGAEYVASRSDVGLAEHTLVIGASGSGKSRGFVKPFIMQCVKRRESIILVDPKGELFESMSGYLTDQNYTVRASNLLDMQNSDGWNCIADIESDRTLVAQIAEIIIRNTSSGDERKDFWEKAEQNLLMAMLHYVTLLSEPNSDRRLPIHERSLGTIYDLLKSENFTHISKRMSELPSSHPAKAPYGIFSLANYQIWGNIAIGLGNRLSVFQNELADKITSHNEIDLELPGREKCAYFCIISDQDSSMEFLSSMFFSMLFARLTNYARRHGDRGRLPVPVNVCLDGFCNVGKLLDFKRILAVARSRRINCQLIVQSLSSLADRYPHMEWEELIGNCDYQLCLGVNDKKSADYLSSKTGLLSIQVVNNQSPVTPFLMPSAPSARYSQTKSSFQRPLMQPDEILRLPNEKCIVFVRGRKPVELYKIIPDELPDFDKLRQIRIAEHIPKWHTEGAKKRGLSMIDSVPGVNDSQPQPIPDNPIQAKTPPPKRKTYEKISLPKESQTMFPGVFDEAPAAKVPVQVTESDKSDILNEENRL